MRILLSGRRFNEPLMGGVDVYADRLGTALERLGHEVSALGFDGAAAIETSALVLEHGNFGDWPAWHIRFAMERRPKRAYDNAYDPEMGGAIAKVLDAARPDLFVILNFYQATLAAVEAAKDRDIPVVHIATDFIPICRRATFIRWDGSPCTAGESTHSCAGCFVSQNPLGRVAGRFLSHLPEATTRRLAGADRDYSWPHPLTPLNPYWRQMRLMDERLRILHRLRRKIDLVLTPTAFTLEAFVANGFESEKVVLLPFAVDANHPLSRVTKVSADHVRFLFVGRLQPYKGVHLLLEAFARLEKRRGATLTIFGAAGEHDDYYRRLRAVMAHNESIDFRGTIPPERLGEAFAVSDYFVLPSTWHENSPLILLDALQSKTPVIASDVGGVTDTVEHEVNGLLFPMGDVEALRRTLQRVIDEPSLAERLCAAVELPVIEDYAQRLLDLCMKRHLLSPRSTTSTQETRECEKPSS